MNNDEVFNINLNILPVILNPISLSNYIQSTTDEEYFKLFNLNILFQDIIKSVICNIKQDQLSSLHEKC